MIAIKSLLFATIVLFAIPILAVITAIGFMAMIIINLTSCIAQEVVNYLNNQRFLTLDDFDNG